jgi:DNA modification methylase
MATLPSESVDLIYLDPPFFSNRIYEVIWGDEAEVRSFEDRWEGGIQVYISWMRDRVLEMRRLLKPNGSLYLHCDPHASHYLKVMLDEVFGGSAYRNEIIWKRTHSHSSAKRYAPIHDVILYYAAGKQPVWNSPRTEYTDEYLNKYYKFDDGDGRLYWRADLCGAGTRNGSSGNTWRGFSPTDKGMHWKFTTERLDELDQEGRIYWPKRGTGWPQYKRYRNELQGLAVSDIWDDIQKLNPKAAERLGYPTQKPEALLTRIIGASTRHGDVVLDPFCGCGTTVSVAEQMDRRWVGIDISPTAVNIMDRRMKRIPGAAWPKLVGLPSTVENLRQLKPFEFQNWVIQQFYGIASARKSGDMGIDGYTFLSHDPIQVKRSDHVGRNVVDNFETAVKRDGSTAGWIVAFSFTKDAREEAARARWHEKLDIKLVTVDQLLKPKAQRRGPFWPEPATVDELPLNPPRDVSKMTADQLITSDLVSSVG